MYPWKYQISRVKHDISFNTRNKSGISNHPCITLYISYHTNIDLKLGRGGGGTYNHLQHVKDTCHFYR